MSTAASVQANASGKIRLLVVNSSLHIGGAEQVAACIAEGTNRQLFDVAAVYLKAHGVIAEQMVRAGVELLQLPGFKAGQQDYFSSLKLRRLVRSRGVNVIHTHDIHGLIDASICRLTVPGLRHVHTFHFGNFPLRYTHYKVIERTLWRVPDAIVAVGHVQSVALHECYGIPTDRMHVIWNGVEDPTCRAHSERFQFVAPPNVPIIGSISTLIPQKGLEFLLQSIALLRDWGERFVLLIVGDGGLRDALQAQADELRLNDFVHFLGWVPQASDKVLPVCDIFVQSSLWEAMSIVVLEAMAAAKPMVVTRVGENSHVVIDGSTGLTVPPGDPVALAEALRTLLHDGDLRLRLGQAARFRYESRFTIRHMISAYQDLYQELASGPDVLRIS